MEVNCFVSLAETHLGEQTLRVAHQLEEAGMDVFDPPLTQLGLIIGRINRNNLRQARKIDGVLIVETERQFKLRTKKKKEITPSLSLVSSIFQK